MAKLIRYWFEFDVKLTDQGIPPGITWGCGLAAYTYDDALFILNECVFKGIPVLPIKKVIEDVDLSTLDKAHVLPNIVIPANHRGVWYPQGYSFL